MSLVLVVDDDLRMARAIQINMQARGHDVTTAQDGQQALQLAVERPPDVVILDLGLPDLDGIEIIRRLRTWTNTPVLVLSGRTDSLDKVDALDAGADDYVTKPFAMDELLARLRAMLRRVSGLEDAPTIAFGRIRVDFTAKRVTADGQDVHLTPTEWNLLAVLIRHPGKLVSQHELLAEVWGPGYENAYGSLRLYMAQLRRKLEPDPSQPRYFHTQSGMGYRFQP